MCCYLLVTAAADVSQHISMLLGLGECVGEMQGAVLAGSSLHGAGSSLEEWLESLPQRGLYLLCFVQGSTTSECHCPENFKVMSYTADVEQTVGLKQREQERLSSWCEIRFLLSEAAEPCFAPVLCCDPFLQMTKSFLSLFSIA